MKLTMVLVGGGNWITGAIQDRSFCSINFHALKDAVERDITKAVGNWKLMVDQEDSSSAECKNTITVTAKDTVTATVCIAALKEGVVDQTRNAISFEEIKARAIVVI
jgi:hypothetical protein